MHALRAVVERIAAAGRDDRYWYWWYRSVPDRYGRWYRCRYRSVPVPVPVPVPVTLLGRYYKKTTRRRRRRRVELVGRAAQCAAVLRPAPHIITSANDVAFG